MIARVLTLIAAAAAFWLVVAVPARYVFDSDMTALFAGVAVLLCLVPGVLTLLWAGYVSRNDPKQATVTALGSSGVRMFVVLVAALLLYMQVPPFRSESSFLFWVIAAYLFTLTVEILLLVGGSRKTSEPGA